ncbi:acetate--CoA ligase family protein [Profundibacter sp.]
MAYDFPDLNRLIAPQSVAVIGASDRAHSVGCEALINLSQHSDFTGEIYPVNPKRDTIMGLKAYPNMASLPDGGVDVAMVCVPADRVLGALRDAADVGTRFAVVFTSGFAETGEEGKLIEAEMQVIARATGMRIYGPNVPGLSNINRRIGLTFSPVFKDDKMGGKIGLVTQGGGLGRSFIQASERNIGIGLWASTGNEADLQLGDFIHHMAHDPDISVIAVLAESLRDGPRFLTAAQAAAKAGKPIIAMKVGQSEYGVKATQSHTAAMAGSAAVTSALFRQHGIVEVNDIDELIDTAALFARAGIRKRKGICVYSFSGGTGALAADMVGSAGLTLAEFAPETVAALKNIAPSYAAVDNPVDLTTAVFTIKDMNRNCLELAAKDPDTDIVLLPTPANYGGITDLAAADVIALAGGDTLFVPVWMAGYDAKGYTALNEAGINPFHSLGKAAKAMKRLIWRGNWQAGDAPDAHPASALPEGALDEAAAKTFLAKAGIPTPRGDVATGASEAATLANSLGYPVVLKALVPGLLHKTEAGGVAIGLADAAAVRAAWGAMEATLAAQDITLKRGLVEQMVTQSGTECVIGLHDDPAFGMVLSFGLGGIFVEAIGDVTYRSVPIGPAEAARMIDDIRGHALLGPLRGRKGVDKAALADVLVAVSKLGVPGRIAELDLNPVLAGPDGVIALDALIVRTENDK